MVKAYNDYINKLFEESDEGAEQKSGMKRFWSYVKSLRKETVSIQGLYHQGKLVTTGYEKAAALSAQYESVFTRPCHSNIPSKGYSPHKTMRDITVTVKGVQNLLAGLKTNKAIGPDLLPTRILRDYADVIAPVFAMLFQKSIDTDSVPKDWQCANIVAIFKKGLKTELANHRPVSLTCVTCKVLEHIIYKQIMDHLESSHILVLFQHGFRKRHSCETQLVSSIEDLARNLEKREQLDLLILDFSKAFDKVEHQRLPYKLKFYGIDGKINKWIENWLVTREQRVVIDGICSKAVHVQSGVPQGTVLGPLMFLIFINDIGEKIDDGTTVKLFADDCLVYRKISTPSDGKPLQQDIDNLLAWSKDWKMDFNAEKCKVLRIANKKSPVATIYNMLGEELEVVVHHPYLGIELDSKLSWNSHVNNITKRATNVLNLVRRDLYSCPENTKAKAYTTIVRPILEYASTVWDPHQANHIKKLEAIQRRAARFVKRDYDRHSSVSDMLQDLNWPTLQERRYIARSCLFHKAVNGNIAVNIPFYIMTPMQLQGRSQRQFINIGANTNTYLYSFFPRTIRCWNILPIEYRQLKEETFKRKLQKEIELKNINVVNPKTHIVHRQVKGLPLTVF